MDEGLKQLPGGEVPDAGLPVATGEYNFGSVRAERPGRGGGKLKEDVDSWRQRDGPLQLAGGGVEYPDLPRLGDLVAAVKNDPKTVGSVPADPARVGAGLPQRFGDPGAVGEVKAGQFAEGGETFITGQDNGTEVSENLVGTCSEVKGT